jgi:hypothetical protein
VDYLLGLTRPYSYFDGAISELPKVGTHGRRDNL